MLHESVVDILSGTLMRMKLQASNAVAMDAGTGWIFESPGWAPLALHIVVKGEQWICPDDQTKPRRIQAGDCVLLAGGRPFTLASEPAQKRPRRLRPDDLLKTLSHGVMTLQGGGSSLSMGAQFQFEGHLPSIVFARLPQMIHIPANDEHSAFLRAMVQRFREEFVEAHLGRSLMMSHLAPIILLQTLRVYLRGAQGTASWLTALTHPKLSRAMQAIHTNYAQKMTLEQLAAIAGMSRSRFALQFKRSVGIAPMDYLAQWRMQVARDLLAEADAGIAAVAQAVGYESASAFSGTFTKVVKMRPGAYQKMIQSAK